MPIFEYECKNPYCKEVVEKLVFDDAETVWCPACSTRCEKIMSVCNAQVNGKYTSKTGYTYEGQNRPLGVA